MSPATLGIPIHCLHLSREFLSSSPTDLVLQYSILNCLKADKIFVVHVPVLDLHVLYKTSKMPSTSPFYLKEKEIILKAIPK